MNDIDFSQYDLESIATPNLFKYELEPLDQPASSELMQQAQKIGEPIDIKRSPQIQEEFSNPTIMPGFEKLPKSEQLQRIALSQFDPANLTSTGTFLPPGAYENPITRMAASVLPTLAQPELSLGTGIASRYLVNPLLNVLNRIGTGLTSNIAYASPEIKNLQDLINLSKGSLEANALMEVPGALFRTGRLASDIYNPSYLYAQNKMNAIKNEAVAAKALQQETYKPVFDKYGNTNVTTDPKKYLMQAGIKRSKLYPEAKKIYDDFMVNPNLNNLHLFQSQIGTDLMSVKSSKVKPKTTQIFNQYRNSLKNLTYKFLDHDKNALAQYKLGSDITKNIVEPYESTHFLRKVAKGVKKETTPEQLRSAIKTGKEKILYTKKNGEVVTAIPETHPLSKHYENIGKRIGFGETLQELVPKVIRENVPSVGKIFQKPGLNALIEKTSPYYYGLGRAGIGYGGEKELEL